MLGFKSFRRAQTLLSGIELLHMIRKGQYKHPQSDGFLPSEQFYLLAVQILAAVAEAERERILERTNDGRLAALAAGVKFGRKSHPLTPAALALILQGEALGSVTEKAGISKATYFMLKGKIKKRC